jgi:hypothetical protein
MDSVMMASFADELRKIAAGNVTDITKPVVGGMGSNIVGKPLPSPGIGKGMAAAKPAPAKPQNYSMVHSNAPMAAFDAGAGSKSVPPPPVRT